MVMVMVESPCFTQGVFNAWNGAEDESDDDDFERLVVKLAEVFSVCLEGKIELKIVFL